MVSWWISWEKGMRSMQPQHPGRKQLRKQTILQIVTSPEGAVSERHPTLSLAPENLGPVCFYIPKSASTGSNQNTAMPPQSKSEPFDFWQSPAVIAPNNFNCILT